MHQLQPGGRGSLVHFSLRIYSVMSLLLYNPETCSGAVLNERAAAVVFRLKASAVWKVTSQD